MNLPIESIVRQTRKRAKHRANFLCVLHVTMKDDKIQNILLTYHFNIIERSPIYQKGMNSLANSLKNSNTKIFFSIQKIIQKN